MIPVFISTDNGNNWKELICHESNALNIKAGGFNGGFKWGMTWDGKITIHRKKANSLVKRLAARAIIYASLHS